MSQDFLMPQLSPYVLPSGHMSSVQLSKESGSCSQKPALVLSTDLFLSASIEIYTSKTMDE